MLEGDRIVPIPDIGTPAPDGLVDLPFDRDGKVRVTFTTPVSELSTLQVRPPFDALPGDYVTVNVTYTDEDGTEETQVRHKCEHCD